MSDLYELCQKVQQGVNLSALEMWQVLLAAYEAGFNPPVGREREFCARMLQQTLSFLEQQDCGVIRMQASTLDPFEWLEFASLSKRIRHCLTSEVDADGTPMLEAAKHAAAYWMNRIFQGQPAPVSRAGLRKAAQMGLALERQISIALWNKYWDIAKDLVEQATSPLPVGLRLAAAMGRADIVKLMLDKDIGVDYSQALWEAARIGHMDIVQILDKHVNRNDYGKALWEAAGEGHKDMVEWILDKLANQFQDDPAAMSSSTASYYDHAIRYASNNGYDDIADMIRTVKNRMAKRLRRY